ncbi:class I SAM-dependent methyltransferase [Candidatus Microgenomates bacterium]|nr:class I SAM-dependent methyltransferase [Candidatus Microgenomates bacterium]
MTKKSTVRWYNQNARRYADHVKTDAGSYHFGLEKPAMFAQLPNLRGKTVLSLGCGAGHDSAELKKRGAVRSVGIDLSKELVKIAQTEHPECEFQVMDMERLKFPYSTFDLVYSSLAMHYLKDWHKVLGEVYRVLKPGGIFLFSSGHPVSDNWQVFMDGEWRIKQVRVEENKQTDEVRIFGNYLDAIEIKSGGNWTGVVSYHRPIELAIGSAIDAGFEITGFYEPKPIKAMKKANPRDYAIHSKLPFIHILKLRKPTK